MGRDSGGARGFTELDIRALLPASPFQHRRAGATCSVCLEEVRGGEMVRSLPGCRHVFHVGCIDPWLHSHATCPLCRCQVSLQQVGVKLTAAADPPDDAPPV